jgi:hypothetical protein
MISLLSPELPPNRTRFNRRPGHVESYFLRANDPRRPRALWLKQTILAPLDGPAVAESWLLWFDAERGTTFAHRASHPFERARFEGDGDPAVRIETDSVVMDIGALRGSARGSAIAAEGRASFDLAWSAEDAPRARPLSILPYRVLRTGPFPRSKLLTPFPSLRFEGTLEVDGETVSLDGWSGMQGHNWGKEHAFEYAWGQCNFDGVEGGDDPNDRVMVEGFTGRVLVAKRPTPRMSALVVRRGAREFRFDQVFDYWRQSATVEKDRWELSLRSRDGEATLRMDASGKPMVCLGYANPDGALAYCFNSKLAEVSLTVRPSDGATFRCHSAHGGALEFLRREPDPRFGRVV